MNYFLHSLFLCVCWGHLVFLLAPLPSMSVLSSDALQSCRSSLVHCWTTGSVSVSEHPSPTLYLPRGVKSHAHVNIVTVELGASITQRPAVEHRITNHPISCSNIYHWSVVSQRHWNILKPPSWAGEHRPALHPRLHRPAPDSLWPIWKQADLHSVFQTCRNFLQSIAVSKGSGQEREVWRSH